MQRIVGQRPEHLGLARSGWWLAGIRDAVSWLRGRCLATVYQTLRRCHVVYKHGRRHIHSPDPAYAAKLATVAYVRERAVQPPQRVVALYEDELTYYRQPSVGFGYALASQDAPRAEQGWAYNARRRIAACLDPRTGQLLAWQRERFGWRTLLRFYQEGVVPAYPDAQRIYVIQDNWPVHFHPQVRVELARADSPIRLVRLPTYAPWTNPVEKVWCKLYAEVLHLHRLAMAWEDLMQTVQAWLDQWHEPAPALLRYVGLLCPN